MNHLSDMKREKNGIELKLKKLEAVRVRIDEKISKWTSDLIEEEHNIALAWTEDATMADKHLGE